MAAWQLTFMRRAKSLPQARSKRRQLSPCRNIQRQFRELGRVTQVSSLVMGSGLTACPWFDGRFVRPFSQAVNKTHDVVLSPLTAQTGANSDDTMQLLLYH